MAASILNSSNGETLRGRAVYDESIGHVTCRKLQTTL